MSREPTRIDVFGLGLLFRASEEGFHARAVFRTAGISASLTSLLHVAPGELDDLLLQIERQYADFGAEVAWRSQDGMVAFRWGLDELGHAAGRLSLRDPAGQWSLEAPLAGDQSWLPQMALGLRLLLRGPGGAGGSAGG